MSAREHGPYGITIYEGERTDGRYLLWTGWLRGQMQGERPRYHSLRKAMKAARAAQARGWDVKITDLGEVLDND